MKKRRHQTSRRVAAAIMPFCVAASVSATAAFAAPPVAPAPAPVPVPNTPKIPATPIVPGSAQPGKPSTPTAQQGSAISLFGKVIYLDPAGQGTAPAAMYKKYVTNGRGGTVPCITPSPVGLYKTAAHTVNWQIAQRLRVALEQLGATVVLSRANDHSFAGCINDRAERATASGANLAIRIDSAATSKEQANKKGFYMVVPTLPIPDKKINTIQSGQGIAATEDIRDGIMTTGEPIAQYLYTDRGIVSKFGAPEQALSSVPFVEVVLGNLANKDDARALRDPHQQTRYAQAIAAGATQFLQSASAPVGTLPPSLPKTPETQQTPSSPDVNTGGSFIQDIINFLQSSAARGTEIISPAQGGQTSPLSTITNLLPR